MCDLKKQKERLLKKITNIREDLTCSICKDIFTDPVTLECHHTFCKNCYTTLLRFSKNTNLVQCPLCKKDMKRRSFLPNTDIEVAIEAVKKYNEIIEKYWKNDGEKSFIAENKENTSPKKKLKNAKSVTKSHEKKTPIKAPEYHVLPVQKNLRKSRSLECIVTKEKTKNKRHSLGNISNATEKEKINIDEFNSQNCFEIFNKITKTDTGKKIIDILEEDGVANLENQFANKSEKALKKPSKNTPINTKTPKSTRVLRCSKNKSSSSDTSEPGWSRMKNTKRNIEPRVKKLKQLNISTFSTNESKKDFTRKSIDNQNKEDENDPSLVKNRPSIKLDQFEAYLQQNLEEKNNDSVTGKESEIKIDSNIFLNIIEERKNEMKAKNTKRKSLSSLIRQNNITNETLSSINESNDAPNKKLRTKPINITESNESSNDTISEQENQFNLNKPQNKELDSDIVFQQSTQKLNQIPQNRVVEENIDDDVFSMPTQRLSLEINSPYFENNIEIISNEDANSQNGFKIPKLNSNKNLEQINTWSPNKINERNSSISSDTSVVNNTENIVVEAQIHKCALDISYIKIPDILNDHNTTTNTTDNQKETSHIDKNIPYLSELTTLQNDVIKNHNIVQELFTILSNSKSLFSTISQEKFEKIESIKKDKTTIQSFPTLSHNSDVVNFYNNAVPYLNNLKQLYYDFNTSIKEITMNTKKLSEIFGQNTDAINALISNKNKNSTLPTTISVNDANLTYTKIVQRVDNSVQTDPLIKCPKCEYIIDSDLNELSNVSVINKENDIRNISSMREIEKSLSNNFIDIDEGIVENKVNRKLEYVGKTYKRIRKQSDSDSEPEQNVQKKSKFGGLEKYDNKDVNIVFLSEATENFSEIQNKNMETNHLSKDELKLQKLLDTYRSNIKRKTYQVDNSDKDDTQDYALKYMMLLEKDYKELNFNEQKNNGNDIKKNTTENKKTDSNTTMHHSLNYSMFDNTLTAGNELNKKEESQFSKSLFTESERNNKTLSICNFNQLPESNQKHSLSMFSENKAIDIEKANLEKNQVLSPKDIFTDKELDDEVAGHLSNSIIDDSLDGTDAFKLDLVDNTPQKDRPKRSFRELQQPRFEYLSKDTDNLISDLDSESTDFLDIAPPPEFQDVEEQPQPTSVPTFNLSSLSPDSTNKQILNKNIELEEIEFIQNNLDISQLQDDFDSNNINTAKKSNLETSFSNVSSSIKNESFIKKPASKHINPLSLVQKDTISPLTITKTITHIPKPVISSTPKQKSILKYMSNTPNKTTNKNDSIVSSNSICLTPHVPNTMNITFEDKMVLTPVKDTQITEHKIEKKPVCIACSRLNRDEIIKIIQLTNKLKLTYSNTFSNDVTHLVVIVDDRNRVRDHTMKYVSSVANGLWILSYAWVLESLAHNKLVPEEFYEVLDVTGIPGPKRSRLTRKENLLLKDFAFYCSEPLLSVTKKDLQNVIINLGGKVVSKLDELISLKCDRRLILTEAKISQDFDQYQTWLEEVHIITVDIEWLSRVVGQYQVTSVRPFVLCLDEQIEDLGYPPSLIAVVPDNFDDTTEMET